MDSRSFPWIQMARLHHTWQLRITSRRACIPSMVLSFKAMARRTGLFPASCDTNATRFLAQTWTRGWKAKGYRCMFLQMGEPSLRSKERKSPGVIWRTCGSWTQIELDVCWAAPTWPAKASHGTGNFRKHLLNQLKRQEFSPMSVPATHITLKQLYWSCTWMRVQHCLEILETQYREAFLP